MSYEILKSEPGNPVFANYAEELRAKGMWLEALKVCLAGLSANPSCHRGRLVLARIYFEQGYIPFSVREVEALKVSLPNVKSIQKLYERFQLSVNSAQNSEEETLAEGDFEISDIELTEDK